MIMFFNQSFFNLNLETYWFSIEDMKENHQEHYENNHDNDNETPDWRRKW